ncbi:MAG TPA: hypothetical protein VFR24_26135 [Candidatus Angelobacter sp.]|nr:hypothetical protein [Candidatus Angelobacter sp.]
MQDQFTAPITYYLQEGKANLHQTVKIALEGAKAHNVKTVVIFTSQGEGVRVAHDAIQAPGSPFADINIVAVTFPQGMQFVDEKQQPMLVDILPENKDLFRRENIPLVRAHMPFHPIPPFFKNRGVLANDLSLVENALNIFGGSMSLCVQAVLMACDAGIVPIGDHVITCTSDTAVLAKATCTTRLLTEFIVREILCKPAIFDIGMKENKEAVLPDQSQQPTLEGEGEIKSLPEAFE